MLSRPEAGEPAGARGQFGGFLSRRTEMTVSACGASVGGSARESNTAPTKGTARAAGCRHKRVDAMLGTNVSECGQFGQGADRIVEIWGTKPGEFHTDACRIGEDCTIDLCDSSRLSVVRDTALSPPTLRARMGLSRVPGWMPRRAAGRKRPHRRAMGRSAGLCVILRTL